MTAKTINALIFPAEGMNAIELHDALSYCVNVKVWGASSVCRTGRYIFENYIDGVPTIKEDGFFSAFRQILREHNIDVVFPTHDTVALFLVQHAEEVPSKIISGDLRTVSICRSKIKTHELFANEDFIPKRYYSPADEVISFPLFAKPDTGQGGQGASIIQSIEELGKVNFNDHLVTEYLPGKEYTVDCLTDFKGDLRHISLRTRDRTMAGISVEGTTVPVSDRVRSIANTINNHLHFLGLWYFQLREDNAGKLKLMEVSARCAGTMGLTRATGVNLPLLSVYTAMEQSVSVTPNEMSVDMERYLTGSYRFHGLYYSRVYLDFDDTVTLRGAVNLNLIRFIYQCKNQGKSIILLTRHVTDIYDTLDRLAISPKLFSEIIPVQDNDSKVRYVSPEDAIFIDNMFKERLEVQRAHHIPVFDVDAVEFLLDRRN